MLGVYLRRRQLRRSPGILPRDSLRPVITQRTAQKHQDSICPGIIVRRGGGNWCGPGEVWARHRGQGVAHSSDSRAGEVPKKFWTEQLSIWSGVPENINLATLFVRPFPLIIYPAVIFAFLGYAVSLAWLVAINILNSFVLQAPPHNWKPSIKGLINIPALLENLIGAWIGGWVIDRYSNWRSKKHGGVFQPKTRLHLLIIPPLLVPAGCLAFGYGVAEQLNWTSLYVHPLRRAPVYAELLCSFFGYGLITVGLIAVPVAAMTYVSDIYLAVNADALLLVNALKNTVAFDFLYGVGPWVTETGYVNSCGTHAGLYVIVLLFALPHVFFGQKLRHVTAGWKLIL